MMPTTIPPQPGLQPANRDVAVNVIRGLLVGPRDVIHYTQESVQINEKTWRHGYRFFIIATDNLFNISGLVTLLFNSKVSDRTQCFSVTQMTADQDREAFLQALRKQLNMPDLILNDLIFNATDALEYTINPYIQSLCETANNQNHKS